jgi:hypothetical protein
VIQIHMPSLAGYRVTLRPAGAEDKLNHGTLTEKPKFESLNLSMGTNPILLPTEELEVARKAEHFASPI